MSDPVPGGQGPTGLPGLVGPVHIVGVGLLGTSIALALRQSGIDVWLSDRTTEHLRTAIGLGAGVAAPADGTPQLVVVAVPPLHVPDVVVAALATGALVTDIGSVKDQPLREIRGRVDAEALTRYVGSHPMAGSERSGPLAATTAIFDGRPWAITPHPTTRPDVIELVRRLVDVCGATPVVLGPAEHDVAVGRTSHLPHLLAVLAAGQLTAASPEDLALSGQGVRDVTRVAAGDPGLYGQIIRANTTVVAGLLLELRSRLDDLIDAMGDESPDRLIGILQRGVDGTRAIPGKHRGPLGPTAAVFVSVPDSPGELARLLAETGETGINVEDLYIDHDPGRPFGLVELIVADEAADRLLAALVDRGWTAHR